MLDTSQWNALLRSAAGYHAFRRIYPSGMKPSLVADFLLFNQAFPRSVSLCVEMLNTRVTELKSRYALRGGSSALEQLDELRAIMDNETIERVIANGLHEFLDGIQVMLNDVGQKLGQDFFGYESPAQTQSQGARQGSTGTS